MKEFKGTPGPWKHNGLSYIHAKNEYGEMDIVAHIADEDGDSVYCRNEEEAMANIALIAAAPDLLAAAEELRAAFVDGCGEATRGPKRKRLVAAGLALDLAIAKAKGDRNE